MMQLKRILATCIVLLISLSVMPAFAKSFPQDNLTALTSTEISEDVEGKEKVEKYYSFKAGPGKVVMTVDMQTNSGTMIDFDFYIMDAKWKNKTGFFDVLGNSINKRTVKELKLNKEQKLILKIVTKPSWGSGSYRVKLEGAVKLSNQ